MARAAAEPRSLARSPRRCAFASQSARPEPGSLGQHGVVAAARRAAGRGRRPSGAAAVGLTSAAPRVLRTAGKGATPVGHGVGVAGRMLRATVCARLLSPRPRGPPACSRTCGGDRPGWAGCPRQSARPGHAGLGVRVCGARLASTPCPPLAPGAGPASPRRSPVALSPGLARMKEGGARTGLCPRGEDWGVRMCWPCKCVSFDVSAAERPSRRAVVGLGVQCA